MTSEDKHQKHVALSRPANGEFGRNELAIMGAPCPVIQDLVRDLADILADRYSLAFLDQDHGAGSRAISDGSIDQRHARLNMTDKIQFHRIDTFRPLSSFDKRAILKQEDLILVNGNHFQAQSQVLIIDPAKDLSKKLDRLSNVKLILYRDRSISLPDVVKNHLSDWQTIPSFFVEETHEIASWISQWMEQQVPPVTGLVLAGGQSKRMKKDKGELVYYEKDQRSHMMDMMGQVCRRSFLSCNARQVDLLKNKFPIIQDTFLDLGPMSGILSAFRFDPNSAWLTVACDLPYLSATTLQYLIAHRNPSKVATVFLDPKGEFPEPLVTLWEPRAYSVMLDYLSQGYSCPRKVLINTEVEILTAPDSGEFFNVNFPEEYMEVRKELKVGSKRKG